MKKRIVFLMGFLMMLTNSCGLKNTKSNDDIIKENKNHITKVNNQDLKEIFSEGALTDISGFKDIGAFKLTYYYNKVDKELLRIENIETTSKVVAENFYYKNGRLIYVSSITDNEPLKQLHLIKGKMLNESNLDKGYKKILLHKAKMLQNEFNKGH